MSAAITEVASQTRRQFLALRYMFLISFFGSLLNCRAHADQIQRAVKALIH
jgi:hypothetical protein